MEKLCLLQKERFSRIQQVVSDSKYPIKKTLMIDL